MSPEVARAAYHAGCGGLYLKAETGVILNVRLDGYSVNLHEDCLVGDYVSHEYTTEFFQTTIFGTQATASRRERKCRASDVPRLSVNASAPRR